MTEVERTDPTLRFKRSRLDTAKLVTSSIAAVAASATLVVALLALVRITTVTSTISDCTTPAGQCYQQQQRINAENRARLVNAAVAAQFCEARSRSLDELQACVTRTLQEIGDQ